MQPPEPVQGDKLLETLAAKANRLRGFRIPAQAVQPVRAEAETVTVFENTFEALLDKMRTSSAEFDGQRKKIRLMEKTTTIEVGASDLKEEDVPPPEEEKKEDEEEVEGDEEEDEEDEEDEDKAGCATAALGHPSPRPVRS